MTTIQVTKSKPKGKESGSFGSTVEEAFPTNLTCMFICGTEVNCSIFEVNVKL